MSARRSNDELADECAKASYETYDDGQDDYSDLFRRAAAALREPQNTCESFEGYLRRRLGDDYSRIVIDALDRDLAPLHAVLNSVTPVEREPEITVTMVKAGRTAEEDYYANPTVERLAQPNNTRLRAIIEAAMKARKP